MNRDEQELELEDQISEEVNDVEEDEVTSDAALLDADGDEDEFVQGSVDADDLATGFNETIPTREVDVDEDTQGDESSQPDGEELPELMTELEVDGGSNDEVRGDDVQLDLEDALTIGTSVTKAPEGD
jgi:hypothetical protein